MRMRCPHCKSWASVRNSIEITPLLRDMFLICKNPACGHTFAAAMEINRTLSPSATPDPAILLPLSPHVRRRDVMEQMARHPMATCDRLPPPDADRSGTDTDDTETSTAALAP
jgi:hypothetical protein